MGPGRGQDPEARGETREGAARGKRPQGGKRTTSRPGRTEGTRAARGRGPAPPVQVAHLRPQRVTRRAPITRREGAHPRL